jgi:Ca2+-binding EF-hand superfamily protein
MHATDTLGESDTSDLKVLFKKFDSGKKGFLSHAEFKGLLALSQINISQEEEYAIFAEYDPELRNQFNYNLVLRSLIEKLYD